MLIEKLKTINLNDETEIDMDTNSVCGLVYENTPLVQKINELVDAVNKQQKQIDKMSCAILDLATPNGENKALKSLKAEPVDQFAEQRRWIGKLCRFWDSVYDRYYFDTLKGITDEGLFIGHNGVWKHCEPVKPDDDIIYKGE